MPCVETVKCIRYSRYAYETDMRLYMAIRMGNFKFEIASIFRYLNCINLLKRYSISECGWGEAIILSIFWDDFEAKTFCSNEKIEDLH